MNTYTPISEAGILELGKITNGKVVKKVMFDGMQYLLEFENGYGASIIKHFGSYGSDRDLFELAVLDDDGRLCYRTPITDDVLGYLTESDVIWVANQIAKLPETVRNKS